MERIRKWLNEKGTYQAGVALLLDIHPDHQLADLFTQEGETNFKRKKLHQVLQELLHSNMQSKPPKKPDLTQDAEQPHQVKDLQEQVDDLNDQVDNLQDQLKDASKKGKVPGRWSHPDEQDPVERSLHDAWHSLYLERSNLQARIYDVAKAGEKDPKQKDAAAAMAFKILDLDKQIRALYEKRDIYFKSGSLPSEPEAEQYAQDPVIAARKLQNHQRYVRTFQKKLQKDPSDEKARQLLSFHQKAVEHYKTFLKIQ